MGANLEHRAAFVAFELNLERDQTVHELVLHARLVHSRWATNFHAVPRVMGLGLVKAR
jgi:hypothetical protein